ncbi:YitT family protein ['Camptotheca acuminata' phytoplasma]|uniref:YitT family protein n=1 Tax='Camptotheca acuminata' phytoplasma TaxID=3239192 RepID=UPI00351A5ADF
MKNRIKFSKKNISPCLFLIFNNILLTLGVYFFVLEPKLNSGGLDGLSLLTIQFLKKFFPNLISNESLITIIFILLYNFLSLIAAYKYFGKKFFFKILFVVLFYNASLWFLTLSIGDERRKWLLSFTNWNRDQYDIILLFFSSVCGGFIFGYSISNIRNLGYNTGGTDIFHKIFKDIYKINFLIAALLTDGIIILFSSFLESGNDYIAFFIRLFFSFLCLVIIGIVMEKRSVLDKSSNEK